MRKKGSLLKDRRLAQWRTALVLTAGIMLMAAPKAHAEKPAQYAIKARVDVTQKTVTAEEVVSFTNPSQKEINDVVFHIYPNRRYDDDEVEFMHRYGAYFRVDPFPTGYKRTPMTFSSIKGPGGELTYRIEGEDETLLRVTLRDPLKPGETVQLNLNFSMPLLECYGRLGWKDNIIKLSYWYPILSVCRSDGWDQTPFYPYHRPFFSDAAMYAVELTVPSDQVVIHSGVKEGEKASPDGQKIWILKTTNPIRGFSLAISPDYKFVSGNVHGVAVKSYYLPGDEKAGRMAMDNVRDVMRAYTKQFGAYPYPEFSIAPVHLGYGGEQQANMVFIDTRAYRMPGFLSRYFDFIVTHETGHQWFYNVVGVDEYNQMWLEEGVNSYFIERYIDEKYGENAEVINYPAWFKAHEWLLPPMTFDRTRDYRYMSTVRNDYDHPVLSSLSSFSEPTTIFSLTYGKGSKILLMLKEEIGAEAFARVFKRVYTEYQFKNIDFKDFMRICEEESGKNLAGFFDQWLKTDKCLNFAVAGVEGDTVILRNRGGIVQPVPVKVDFADGTSKTFTWSGEKKIDRVKVDSASAIKKVAIDPEKKYLDIDRTNNFWPRKFNVQPVPVYWGLYDIPLFLPEDSYNVVVGPEVANNSLGLKASVQKPYEHRLYGGTGYEWGESLQHSRVGYQVDNLFKTQTSAGVEVANTTDSDGGEEDVVSGKVFIRRELWPVAYNITDINDHITLYMIRNQRLSDNKELLGDGEYDSGLEYSRRKESIVGTALHLNRAGTSPDPRRGMKLDWNVESAGHFLGATQYFYRSGIDSRFYFPVFARSTVAARAKYGWGYPDDKDLYQMGGIDDLRGYSWKSTRGANILLGSLEYRFPLLTGLEFSALDHIVGLESIGGVVFFDAGQGWFGRIADSPLRKDVGVGLRFVVNIGSMIEKLVVRADAAQAINDPAEDTHFWLGINQSF